MRKDALHQGLPAPDEAYVNYHYLDQGVEAPDLVAIKDFFRFYIAISCGRIVVKPTVDLINTNAEWLFAGFPYITGTGLNAECSRIAQLIRFMACALSSLFLIQYSFY